MWLALHDGTVARTYFNDVDEEFFRAGEDIADERPQRSYTDLQEFDGFQPGPFRRAVRRVARARRSLILAGVFLAGAIVGFAIATLSGGSSPAALAVPTVAAPGPAPSAPAPSTATPAPPPPATALAVSSTAARPARIAAVAQPAPVVAQPAAETAAKPTSRTSPAPTRRAASRASAKPRSRHGKSAPVFPY